MTKVLTLEDIKKKNCARLAYAHPYTVAFLHFFDGEWKRVSRTYFAKTKDDHQAVLTQFKKDSGASLVKDIEIIYQ